MAYGDTACYTQIKSENWPKKGPQVMQYNFCPRCKFRMIAAKKHICLTCGYKVPNNDQSTAHAAFDSASEAEHSFGTPRIWSKIFKWEFDSADAESTQEKPALS